MYKVIIKRDGATDEIMETDKMTSRDVDKSVLADIKRLAHMEKLSGYDKDYMYDAYVYKNGKPTYLLRSSTRFLDSEWIGITRATDLKTCVIRSIV